MTVHNDVQCYPADVRYWTIQLKSFFARRTNKQKKHMIALVNSQRGSPIRSTSHVTPACWFVQQLAARPVVAGHNARCRSSPRQFTLLSHWTLLPKPKYVPRCALAVPLWIIHTRMRKVIPGKEVVHWKEWNIRWLLVETFD